MMVEGKRILLNLKVFVFSFCIVFIIPYPYKIFMGNLVYLKTSKNRPFLPGQYTKLDVYSFCVEDSSPNHKSTTRLGTASVIGFSRLWSRVPGSQVYT